MSKKIGNDLDFDLHNSMLQSFTKFIEDFSPLLDHVEKYHKNINAENLINPSHENESKLKLINEALDTLNEMIPSFFKIAIIEDKLEKFYNK